ncbi:MAG: glycogen debranching enzyme GlgX [Microbacterium sp. SCN 70-200]|mgnify:CR=1 FL=1|uniref:glycogen debranching protein GlgX n=1 Tax=unclassified Microbacterium TaxID=2609290 RepID=UPI00086D9193|nr:MULTISPECIES: glycogen debranching protein GlgX [unclassified Microbacterium]MBN9214532.1 glycogen debranching protein GlgX [Microbacterium sp.]ODT41427.1 MAG: glycogen debranching enzyme GlgX [Microbacterium sp. SCN 70-200]OJV84093.1 MAG: glycogen debranching enzyme GlgX [Microbacterium sp. 70-16]
MAIPQPIAPPALLDPAYDGLGVTLGPDGGTLRVWSENATSIELVVCDPVDLDWITEVVPLAPVGGGVWQVTTSALELGTRYALRVDGPTDATDTFNPATLLIDPYSKGLVRVRRGQWRSVVTDDRYDWEGVGRPATPLDRTVIYEAHVKGLTKRHPDIPPALHGTYAGLGHPAMIEHLTSLGVTAVELLPIHAFVTEPRLLTQGLTNYWGYNTLAFFAPHAPYATAEANAAGPDAVLRELKDAVKALHAAGIEVILDVVYNHTSELELGGPRTSFRGIDNARYYRQHDDGAYIDVTGCGNAVNTSTDAAARLVLDSLRYWAQEVQIDGFRFDLAATLGRDATHEFQPDHPLLEAIVSDPALAGLKMIAEPWDVGIGGWQTGSFGVGWSEWNDRYRDRVRNFWLSDVDYMRRAGVPPVGVGGFATRLAGSSNTFSTERGPLASINFVTAHDGFTLRDLVSYDVKHNLGNGEQGRDGTDTNRSFNHGAEGKTTDLGILATRRKAMRNLFGTLLLSAGVPMITAGDEFARTQRGNNNAYCHDSPLTWIDWRHAPWQDDLHAHVQRLTQLRRENPALRPRRFADAVRTVPSASVIDWYDEHGETMSIDRWTDSGHRTLQYVAQSTPQEEAPNRILLVVHGNERPIDVTLPRIPGVTAYRSLWSSVPDRPSTDEPVFAPGDVVSLPGTALHLFRVE